VLLVGLSALVGLWFRPATYHSAYLFFYAAILISLIYGGLGPGLASTFLSALLVNHLFQPPYGQFSFDLASLARGSYFCLSFGFICWLVDTRRKAAEGQIQTQRLLLDMAATPVIMCDEDDRITYWNKGAEAVYGWNGEEAIGQRITELLHSVLPEPIEEIKRQLTSVGQWSGELKRTGKDGSAAFIASSWTLRQIGRHGLTRLESDHDLTEHRKAEERLRGSEDQFRTMANAMPQLAWMANLDGWIFWYNQGWYDYTGTTPQQMEGWSWQSVHDPAELPKVMERWQASIATSEPFEMVFPLRSAHGEYRAFLTRVSPIKDASGEVLRWFGTNTDVDEQKRTEEALIESQQRLAGIVGSAMDAIITVDEQQRIVLFNAAAERMFRCAEAEALGEPIERFVPQRFRAAHAGHIRDFGETNVTNRTVGALGGLWALRADGEELRIEASISSVERRGKKLFTVILRDITERMQMEDNLRKSEDRYRDLVENSQDLICTHDLEGKLLSANQAPARVLGYEVAELLNTPMREIIAPEFREQFDQYLVRLKNHGADKGLMAVLTRTGERRIWEYDNTLRTEGVPAPIVRGMAHDVTERKRAEQALRDSQERMAAVMENLTEGLIIAEAKGSVFYWNSAALAMFGYASVEECRRKLAEFTDTFEVRPLDDDHLLPVADWPMSRVQRGEVLRDWEVRIRRRDQGWEKILAYSGWLIHSAHGEKLAFVSTSDITERKRAEADLQEREEQLRLFVEYAPAALAMSDREMRYLSVSRRWRADHGLGDRELRGVSHYEVFRELPERWKAAHRRGLAGEVLREDDDCFERVDGTVQSVAWQVRPWHDPRGEIGGIVIFTEDITESLESQFRSPTGSFGPTASFVGLKSPPRQNSMLVDSLFGLSVSFGTLRKVANSRHNFAKRKKWKPSVDFRVVSPMTSTTY
jgi:PAS domain S-box-containing protein